MREVLEYYAESTGVLCGKYRGTMRMVLEYCTGSAMTVLKYCVGSAS